MSDPSAPDYVLVYDGDCAFCQYTVDYAAAVVGDAVRFRTFQDAAGDYPDVPLESFRASIQLFTPDGRFSGADAAFRVLALEPRLRGWHWCYRNLPLFAFFAELAYRLTSRHRGTAMRLARLAFGKALLPLSYGRTARVLTRSIGLVFMIAFASFAVQADGLIGPGGILPLGTFFDSVHAQLGSTGYYLVPSAYWFWPTMATTWVLMAVGGTAALLLLLNRLTVIAALLAYGAYLSVFYGGQVFMGYQWDILLIECGALLVILNLDTRVGIWLFRLLVFRFMFLSGAVKLLSGDPTWADLSALGYHFETQPLPTVLAWYAHQLPDAMLRLGVAATFVVELLLPFFIFLPRNFRFVAFAGFVLLELLILATGNYNFFNLLTILICLSLLDDRVFGGRAPERAPARRGPWRAVFAGFLLLGVVQIHATFARRELPSWERSLLSAVRPWALVNGYGLFAVMTTHRDELIVQGSDDGETWWDYGFRFKPQALDAAPRWITPHQPRLDWQMWFAALAPSRGVYWMNGFIARLLLDSKSVEDLMVPTGRPPPQHLRILRYRYTFTTPEKRAASGQWWNRSFVDVWYGPVSLITAPAPTDLP